MRLQKCDRCGKIDEHDYKKFGNIEISNPDNMYNDIRKDVCVNCIRQIVSFMNSANIQEPKETTLDKINNFIRKIKNL